MKYELLWNDSIGLLHTKAFRGYAQARAFKAKLQTKGICTVIVREIKRRMGA